MRLTGPEPGLTSLPLVYTLPNPCQVMPRTLPTRSCRIALGMGEAHDVVLSALGPLPYLRAYKELREVRGH